MRPETYGGTLLLIVCSCGPMVLSSQAHDQGWALPVALAVALFGGALLSTMEAKRRAAAPSLLFDALIEQVKAFVAAQRRRI